MKHSDLENAICPGCGWRGPVTLNLACPDCRWENNMPPYRLLTLNELMIDSEGVYNDIRMDLFLSSVAQEINNDFDGPRNEVRRGDPL